MDPSVQAALAKWPNVPDCYDWLALDLRGHWRLGQERQSITNPTMNAFIGRNYDHDAKGRWLFQNGPQRVFVALDYTPWVWRLLPDDAGLALANHVGTRVPTPDAVWIDEKGRFLIEAQGMLGVLHDHDVEILIDLLVDQHGHQLPADHLADALERAVADHTTGLRIKWNGAQELSLKFIKSHHVAAHFAFDPHPSAVTDGQAHEG